MATLRILVHLPHISPNLRFGGFSFPEMTGRAIETFKYKPTGFFSILGMIEYGWLNSLTLWSIRNAHKPRPIEITIGEAPGWRDERIDSLPYGYFAPDIIEDVGDIRFEIHRPYDVAAILGIITFERSTQGRL